MRKYIALLAGVAILFTACNNNDEPGNIISDPGSLNLVFENTVDGTPLAMAPVTYTNSSNETYTINELKYIISNITLIKTDNTEYIYPVENSYFLINEDGSKTANLSDIPADTYKGIKFGFGVDPTKYPIESGTLNFIPLAEEAGMLWTWSAGYKFLKFEGDFTDATNPDDVTPFLYHVGSHGANLDNYKEVTLTLNEFQISGENTMSKTIQFDVAKIFDSVHTLSLEEKNEIMVDPENAPKIAENTSTAFSIIE
ncbi:MbnP family protein [uncultured Dokdonia sp.]|uniref:MbnP family protein n=1 Tax=uncultured Dokdonia sp. TaxID=575653 RepID=UPI00263188FD|nr:MbnP family protein [uncultured Dokdonia sp.]